MNFLMQEESLPLTSNFVISPCTIDNATEIDTLFSSLRNPVATFSCSNTFGKSSRMTQCVGDNSRYSGTSLNGHLSWVVTSPQHNSHVTTVPTISQSVCTQIVCIKQVTSITRMYNSQLEQSQTALRYTKDRPEQL